MSGLHNNGQREENSYQSIAQNAVRSRLEKELNLSSIIDGIINNLAKDIVIGSDLLNDNWVDLAFKRRGANLITDFNIEFEKLYKVQVKHALTQDTIHQNALEVRRATNREYAGSVNSI